MPRHKRLAAARCGQPQIGEVPLQLAVVQDPALVTQHGYFGRSAGPRGGGPAVAAAALLLLLLPPLLLQQFVPSPPFSFPLGFRVDVVVLLAGQAQVHVLRYELRGVEAPADGAFTGVPRGRAGP